MAAHASLHQTAHRPWPLSARPWLLRQTWHDLLFLHWPVPAGALRPLLPPALEVDEFEGTAWVAVTPFWMSDIALGNWPAVPLVSRFEELNVRTYVKLAGRAGVWFFSLDAGGLLGVFAARFLYGLPYVYARMRHQRLGDEVRYFSRRREGQGFEARYGPTGPVNPSRPGSLEHFLTERYCLYVQRPSGLYRADIHHVPWPLQPARAEIERNDMLAVHKIPASGPAALLHFSRTLDVIVWSLERAAAPSLAGPGSAADIGAARPAPGDSGRASPHTPRGGTDAHQAD